MQAFRRNPLPAMLWELWRVSRFELVVRFAAVAAFVLLIFCLSQDFNGPQLAVVRGIMLMLLGIASVFSVTWMSDLDNRQTGFTFRLGYTRPISNLQLVLVPMAYSVATAMAGYVACALFAQVMLGQPMPLLGPALIFGCTVCVLTCVAWSSTRITEKLIGICLAALAMIGALTARHSLRPGTEPILLAIGKPHYFDLVWYEYLCLFAISAIAAAVTVFAVGRQRFGEGWRWSLLPASALKSLLRQRWLVACSNRLEAAIRPSAFPGPLVAQCWFEARRSIYLLLVASLCPALVLAFVVIVPFVNNSWGGAHSPRLWLGAIVFTPLLYQLLATDPVVGLQHRQGSTQLSLFDATRPLRCDQLIAIKLLVIAGWSVFGFLLMTLVAVTHATLAGQWHYWNEMQQAMLSAVQEIVAGEWGQSAEHVTASTLAPQEFSGLWWLAGLCNLALFYGCSTAMLLTFVLWMAKHSKLMAGLGITIILHICLFSWDVSHGRLLNLLWQAYGYLIPTAIILLSLFTLKVALSARCLSWQYFAVAFCFWSIYVATTVIALLKVISVVPLESIHPLAWLLTIACWLMPLASIASAPLALAEQRHG